MKKRLMVVIILLIFVASGLGYTYINSINKAPLKSSYKKVRIVMDDNYPPYIFRDSNGNLQGISVDQWKLWEKKTGIPVEINAMDWDTALTKMKSGEYDVIDTIFENGERDKIYDFSSSYAKIEVPIFFQNNISGITDVQSLKGFTVAVKKGDNTVHLLRDSGINNIEEFDSYESIIDAAKNKKIVVFIMDKPPALYFMYKYSINNLFNYSKPLYTGEFHRAVKKGNSELLNTINTGFSMISGVEYNAINVKWFGISSIFRDYIDYIQYGFLVIILIIFMLILWNIMLKTKVKDKTLQLVGTLDKLKQSENRNMAIIKAIPDLIFVINREGIFKDFLSVDSNENLYVPMEQFLNMSMYDIFPEELSNKFKAGLDRVIETRENQSIEYSLEITGQISTYEGRAVFLESDLILVIVRNITERKVAEKQIYEMSMHDALTGLYNRHYFENEVSKYEEAGLLNIGVVVCDIDGLKLVNDTFGHSEGDHYIRIAADILRMSFKQDAVIARIGGDEFAALLKETSEEEIQTNKVFMQGEIDKENYKGLLIPLSISFGYAVLQEKGRNINDIFKEADEYMYHEKIYHKQSSKSKNIETLSKMIEARDFITEGHGERMKELATTLSSFLGMKENKIKDIGLLAEFHDIGKVGIPDAILFKPGKLTEEERIVMKRHSEIGYRIAEHSPFLKHISDWILKHHERWDGDGYPFGLKGEDIPLQCRILAIVDAYDAMTNDRPYRKALSKDKAIAELKLCAGTQFDPTIMDKFLEIIK